MAWPEIIATGAVTLIGGLGGGLGGVLLTFRYQAEESRKTEQRLRIQAENERILQLAEAGHEIARDIQTLAMYHFQRQSGVPVDRPEAAIAAFDDAQFQVRQVQLAIRLLGPHSIEDVAQRLVQQSGKALVAASQVATSGISKQQFEEMNGLAEQIRATIDEVLLTRTTASEAVRSAALARPVDGLREAGQE